MRQNNRYSGILFVLATNDIIRFTNGSNTSPEKFRLFKRYDNIANKEYVSSTIILDQGPTAEMLLHFQRTFSKSTKLVYSIVMIKNVLSKNALCGSIQCSNALDYWFAYC